MKQRAALKRLREEKQQQITGYLSATEREIGRARLHNLCGPYGFFDRDGMEKLVVNEALKKLDRRGDNAQGYVVMMIDLGGLGRINDEGGGHAMGDQALMQAAEVIGSNTRDRFKGNVWGRRVYRCRPGA